MVIFIEMIGRNDKKCGRISCRCQRNKIKTVQKYREDICKAYRIEKIPRGDSMEAKLSAIEEQQKVT